MWSIVRIKLERSKADSKGFCSPALTPAACPSPPCCSDRSECSELGQRMALEEKWENALKLKGRNVSGKITVLRMGRSTRLEAQMFCSHQSRNFIFLHTSLVQQNALLPLIIMYSLIREDLCSMRFWRQNERTAACAPSLIPKTGLSSTLLSGWRYKDLLCRLYHSSKTLSYVNLL